MDNKYYTPTIEEFHVGFEYEWNNPNEDDIWRDSIACREDCYYAVEDLIHEFRFNYRVKYLDKEDIESLGFKYIENNSFESNEDNYLSLEYFKDDKGWYLTYSENESQFGFGGWIKNKSELITLLKQLSI